jgi:hypothetical protein
MTKDTILRNCLGTVAMLGATLPLCGQMTVNLSPSGDTYLEGPGGDANAVVNFGSAPELRIKSQFTTTNQDNGRSAWMNFTLPSDFATATSAALTLTGAGGNSLEVDIWGVETSAPGNVSDVIGFTESSLTWNSLPGDLQGGGSDVDSAIDTSGLLLIDGSVAFSGSAYTTSDGDLLSFLNANGTAGGVVTLAITRPTQDNNVTTEIFSREGASAPEVALTYTPVPEPPTYVLVLGGLGLAVVMYRRRRG